MWRDEFLAREQAADRERRIGETIRLRRLLDLDLVEMQRVSGRGPGRRTVARLMSGIARAAAAAARRLDPEVQARA